MRNLSYLSKTPGIGGKLKSKPEDFLVEEICSDGLVLELDKKIVKETGNAEQGKRFTHFVLQKKNWSTTNAIKEIAKRLHISHTRFNVAGMKDKIAVTTQLVSVFGVQPEKILALNALNIKDISINGAWPAKEKVKLGSLIGNRFRIRVSDAKNDQEKVVSDIYSELGGKFPNYFGEQRFGSSRTNTHIIGEKILKKDFESAVLTYLTDVTGEENSEATAARQELKQTMDFASALKIFPKHLRLERMMLAHLARYPNDSIGALRKLPRNILLLFIHAFQSHLFNILVSERIKEGALKKEKGEYFCGNNSHGFPEIEKKADSGWLVVKLIGYETELSEREAALLEKIGIDKSDFKIKSMPEISSRGAYRLFFAPLLDFRFSDGVFSFSLPSGSYATMALREFLDQSKEN